MSAWKISIIFCTFAVVELTAQVDVCELPVNIISSLSQADCNGLNDPEDTSYKYYLFQNGGEPKKCFPYCQKVETGLTGLKMCGPTIPCPPGYTCTPVNDFDTHCVLDVNSCHKYYVNYDKKDNPYFIAFWTPECLPDGTWAPKQCKGEKFTGRCFCYDEIGNRIDGQQWASKAENMTCACSRKRSEMMKTNTFVSLHCDDEGNYEPLQCNEGQCWCVEPKTGEIRSQIVVDSMMKILPCYDRLVNGDQYLRQCESQLFAQLKIVSQLRTHGTVGFKYDKILCDADGTYGIYKISEGRASCVWKDNTQLGSYQLVLATENIELMNCNCARDGRIYESAGLSPDMRGLCNSMGNYEPIQVKLSEDGKKQYYCVDSDGFQKSPLLNKKPPNCAIYK